MSARENLRMDIWEVIPDEDAEALIDAYRAEVLAEAAAELYRIADTVEARVAEHYGSGIGPGSAEMIREAARTVQDMAGKDTREGESTHTSGGRFERVTVNLAPLSSAALDHAAGITGDSKTDTINRALQIYAHQTEVVADGGRVLTQHAAEQTTQADRIMAWALGGRVLRCLDHAPSDLTGFTPVTAGDLPDGGICTAPDCGADVLITPEPFVPRTEREYWVAIADALNAANAAGMPVGIDMEGILTDHRGWAVVWNRQAERWEVGGYDDDPPAEDPDPDRWLRCSRTHPSCLNAERARYAVERGWTQDGRAGDWLCTEHAPGGQLPATVEFSDGTVTLTRWDIVELAPDYYGYTFMQIGGWLPEGWKSGSISLGTNSMIRADLPGAVAPAPDLNVLLDVTGYGSPLRYMKIRWRHAYDPAKDHRRTGGEAV